MTGILSPDQRDLIIATVWAMERMHAWADRQWGGVPPMHLHPGADHLEVPIEDDTEGFAATGSRLTIRLGNANPPLTGRPLLFEVWEPEGAEPALGFVLTVPAHVFGGPDGGPGGGGERVAA